MVAEHGQIIDEEQRLQDIAAAKQADVTEREDGQQVTWGEEDASEEPINERPTKTKTHRTISDEELEMLRVGLDELHVADAEEEEEPTNTNKPQIAVKKDNLDVFSKMFRSAESASVRWIQLVQALTDAGMTATQNPGSGVKFTIGQDKRNIVIDKPHPEAVVDAVMLRRSVGGRLKKKFGWDAETFVLRKKGEEEPDKLD